MCPTSWLPCFYLIFQVFFTFVNPLTHNLYTKGDPVEVYVNTVGPYFNPFERYNYYDLPLCKPPIIETKTTFGLISTGEQLSNSPYNIKFLGFVEREKICSLPLKTEDIRLLRNAVDHRYLFKIYIDDIPLSNFLGEFQEAGESDTKEMFLYRHYNFTVFYRANQIIYASVNVSTPFRLPEGISVAQEDFLTDQFYSVYWVETNKNYEDLALSVGNYRPLELQWLSTVPGTIIVVFLALFLALTLLRGLKSDFVRFSIEDSEFSGLLDEQGWKLISGDVFRPPLNLHLFCAILGNGAQLLSVTCILLLMAMLRERGLYYYAELQRMTLVLYILTSLISGTISSYFYKQLGGTYWKRTLLTTNLLFIGPLFLDWCVMYSFSLYYGITPSLHYSSVLLLVILWLLVGFPLTVAGSLIGRRTTKVFDFPCRPNTIPRELPKLPWSKSRAFYLLAGGVVPFLALLFGLFCIFQNIWGRQSGLSYGLLAVVFTLALVNTAFVSIYLVFSRLDSEDYHWWWPSIFNTGFSSVLLLIFSLWYYHFWSRMHGPFQAAHFYGHVFVLGYSIFLILGFVGFVSSLKFVKYIYGSIKMD